MLNEDLFRIVTALILIAAFVISGYFRSKADREGGRLNDPQGQRLVRVLRLLGLVAFLPLIGYLIYPAWVAWARFTLPDWVRWLAAVVAVSLLPVFVWIFVSLGPNISPTAATRQGHTLVTHGPYRWVRHPLYTSGLIMALALTLLTSLWWLPVAGLPPLIVLWWRTPKEEARLMETFGEAYREYMQRTGRFFPKLG